MKKALSIFMSTLLVLVFMIPSGAIALDSSDTSVQTDTPESAQMQNGSVGVSAEGLTEPTQEEAETQLTVEEVKGGTESSSNDGPVISSLKRADKLALASSFSLLGSGSATPLQSPNASLCNVA